MIRTRHTIELKLPKLFGRKKEEGDKEAEVKTTHIDLEDKEKYIFFGGAIVMGLVVGYFIGHHKGARRTPQNFLVLK